MRLTSPDLMWSARASSVRASSLCGSPGVVGRDEKKLNMAQAELARPGRGVDFFYYYFLLS